MNMSKSFYNSNALTISAGGCDLQRAQLVGERAARGGPVGDQLAPQRPALLAALLRRQGLPAQGPRKRPGTYRAPAVIERNSGRNGAVYCGTERTSVGDR